MSIVRPSALPTTAVVLAAGFGTRMKSALPKTLHPIAGRPMLRHLLATCEAVFDRIVVVVGPDMDAVRNLAAPHPCVEQTDRLGTAHAALQATAHFGEGDVAVLYADNPLISEATLRALLARRQSGAGLALLAMRPADPARYGRVVGPEDNVERIVEFKDATEAEREIGLCNAGVLCAAAPDMARWLAATIAQKIDRFRCQEQTTAITEPRPTPSRTTLKTPPPGRVSKTISARRGMVRDSFSSRSIIRKVFRGVFGRGARSGRAEHRARGRDCGRRDQGGTVGLGKMPVGGSGGGIFEVGRWRWRASAKGGAGVGG